MADIRNLLPCPHCGANAEIKGFPIGEDRITYIVVCKGCYAKSGHYNGADMAIRMWNKRVKNEQ